MKTKNKSTTALLLFMSALYGFFLISCGSKSENMSKSIVHIVNGVEQDSIFKNLISLTKNVIPEISQNDSLAFLILPVQASCPSCRKKTIDSIVKHKNNIDNKHFIVISANGGLKTINSYFLEQTTVLPQIDNKLFLDSLNKAYKYDLYDEKPTIYYTYKRKAYKKVAAIPSTVKQDLQEFFSGYRD